MVLDSSEPFSIIFNNKGVILVFIKKDIIWGSFDFTNVPITLKEVSFKYS